MMDERERLAEIQAILDELASRAAEGAVILVEGRRDKASLEELGVKGNIVMTSQKQLFNLAECVSRQHKDIIILSDWDVRGDEVARSAEAFLKSNCARPDVEIRRRLRILTQKEIMDVESLYGYMERLKSQCITKQAGTRR
ncbi:toprim domain-containing protein [Methanocella conradii]|uniref:toprim domain-containing protein n=1 Tax=Methanocella conradii TaxID=1175444 RepID=UPI0024B3C4FD|nr:toprim domain-containing protein [Methanocella conradii]MDI6897719.1 toprim domain-containing protein [Methanocella conradii]